ncbi:MarR family transcriptional regulator [Saccharopolyspora sp. NPDC047091]|uniref:MarR family winged helix-turn-helix transcriptional regulator n=1 Tax=Saccharopolyspora sp. NPDC047091 TaxID=3155924 RepID=UPI0033EE41DB
MDEPRWLTDEEQKAWRQLAMLMTLLPPALDSQLQRDSGVTHFGYWVMAMLSERPDRSLRMSDLAARASASPSRVSHVVARLEKNGWVRRARSSCDGRSNLAELTDAGYRKVVDAAPGHVERVRDLVLDALTGPQLQEMGEICGAMLRRIDPDGRKGTRPLTD